MMTETRKIDKEIEELKREQKKAFKSFNLTKINTINNTIYNLTQKKNKLEQAKKEQEFAERLDKAIYEKLEQEHQLEL